jgi:REP element-mobilizing transposase RayT
MRPVGRVLSHIMGNTYSQVSIHAVFTVKGRENFIIKPWRDDLHKYIYGIINGINEKPLAVGGWKDHVHIFFGMKMTTRIADVLEKVKANSS